MLTLLLTANQPGKNNNFILNFISTNVTPAYQTPEIFIISYIEGSQCLESGHGVCTYEVEDEVVIFARLLRGQQTFKKIGRFAAKKVKQWIKAPAFIHSKKPNEVREKIVQLYGDIPRIEIFARTKVHGWDVIGNDEKLQNQPLEVFS